MPWGGCSNAAALGDGAAAGDDGLQVTAGKGSEDTGVDASEAPAVRSAYHEFPQLEPSALKALGSDFQAVYINSGWDADADPMARLQQLPISRLCPIGFVFMWVPKTLVQPVVRQMFKWGYAYIENLTWVTLAPNHSFLELEASYIRRSHLTLYMFRKICEAPTQNRLFCARNKEKQVGGGIGKVEVERSGRHAKQMSPRRLMGRIRNWNQAKLIWASRYVWVPRRHLSTVYSVAQSLVTPPQAKKARKSS